MNAKLFSFTHMSYPITEQKYIPSSPGHLVHCSGVPGTESSMSGQPVEESTCLALQRLHSWPF